MAEKRTRRTRAELRELMIQAGQQVLLGLEPTLGFDGLTYKAVFEHLQTHHDQKVTIGSVHERVWPNMRAYQLDVIDAALSQPLDVLPNDMFERALAALEDIDSNTVEARKYAVATATRLSSYHLHHVPHHPAVQIAHTVRLRLFGLRPDNLEALEFGPTILEIRERSTEAYCTVVRAMMPVLGLRVRADAGDPEQVIREVALLGNAAEVGLQSDLLRDAHEPRELPTGLHGEIEEWYPDALARWYNIRANFELDDDTLSEEERRL